MAVKIQSLSHDLTRPRVQRVMEFSGQENIKISYHPVKFGSHRNSSSENIIILVSHMIWKDHVTRSSLWLYRQQPIKVD